MGGLIFGGHEQVFRDCKQHQFNDLGRTVPFEGRAVSKAIAL